MSISKPPKKSQVLEESIGFFCTEALLTWMFFSTVYLCSHINPYLVKDVLVSLMMDKFRQVSLQYRQFTRNLAWIIFSLHFLFFFIQTLHWKFTLKSNLSNRLWPYGKHWKDTKCQCLYTRWVRTNSSKQSRIEPDFQLHTSLQSQRKKWWVIFLNCFIFFFQLDLKLTFIFEKLTL